MKFSDDIKKFIDLVKKSGLALKTVKKKLSYQECL